MQQILAVYFDAGAVNIFCVVNDEVEANFLCPLLSESVGRRNIISALEFRVIINLQTGVTYKSDVDLLRAISTVKIHIPRIRFNIRKVGGKKVNYNNCNFNYARRTMNARNIVKTQIYQF